MIFWNRSRAPNTINPAAQFQWKDLLKAYPATRLIGFPVMNLYNLHHVRCLVGLLPRATDIPMDLEDSYWQNNPFGFGADLSRTVDASLNDLCALAAAKTNLLAGDYRDTSAFANALAAHIRKTIHCEGVSNFLVNATGDRLQCASTTGIKWSVPITEQFYKRNEKTTGLVWEQNEPLLFRNIKADNPKHEAKSREFGGGVNEDRDNVLFVPLVNYKGDVKGVVRCRNKHSVQATSNVSEETVFTHDDAALVDSIGQAAMPHFDILQSYVQRARAVARLTHELSLPLIAIRGCVDLIQEELGAFSDGSHIVFDYDYMGDIWSWSDLMLGLQSNAELYGNPAKHLQLKIDGRILLSAAVIEPAVRQVNILLRERGFSPKNITHALIYDIPALYIDKNRFQQVLFNLMSNAIKYAFNDTALFCVKIGGKRCGNYYEIFIRDEGSGILPEYGQSIFEEGVRGREGINKYVAGQGLGLWVVRRIMEAHGGFVRVTNHYRPTEITLYLPISLAIHAPAQTNSQGRE